MEAWQKVVILISNVNNKNILKFKISVINKLLTVEKLKFIHYCIILDFAITLYLTEKLASTIYLSKLYQEIISYKLQASYKNL